MNSNHVVFFERGQRVPPSGENSGADRHARDSILKTTAPWNKIIESEMFEMHLHCCGDKLSQCEA